ncbi:CsgG/HfaB family protein [Maribacter sp. CXY002]|uniref:CsgG/HfaB family protein n=1 Tax=Maribacter luteocoastalis TaxID=3407671 RepID=UPI003B66F707
MVDKQPIFDVSKAENIIISEIVNNVEREDNHTIDIYDEFVNQVTNIEGLKLIDRDKTSSLLKELDFQRSGYVDENQIRKIGKFYSSGLIVFGRIQADEFSQSIKKNKTLIGGNGCPEQKRVGWYQLNVNLKIIDLKTAEVVFSDNIKTDVRKEGPKYNCEYPPSLSSVEFFQIAKENIGVQFRELFTVHQKEYEIDFQTHRSFNDDLKKAITLLEIDDFDGGFTKIKEIAQTTSDEKARSFALYNLAKMQLFNGEYVESLKNAKQAYLLNPKNDACLEIINELK